MSTPRDPAIALLRPLTVLTPESEPEQPLAHVTPAELAQILAVSVKRLERWRSQNKGPPFTRVGRSVRYALPEVQAWLRRNTVAGTA